MNSTINARTGGAAMSLQEIADELGITPGAVHMTLNRALKKLRAHGLIPQMKELGIALDAGRKSVEWTN